MGLLESVVAESKELRRVAEQNARNQIISAVAPKIKSLIERELLGEDHTEDDEKDILLGADEEETTDDDEDNDETEDGDKDLATEQKCDVSEEKSNVSENSEDDDSDEYILNTESIKALTDLIQESSKENAIELSLLKLENQLLKDKNNIFANGAYSSINEEINNISKIIKEDKDNIGKDKLESFQSSLEAIKAQLSALAADKTKLVKEGLNSIAEKLGYAKESKKVGNQVKATYAKHILKKAKSLCEEANQIKSLFSEEEIKVLSTNLDTISNLYKEIKEMSTKKELNENELMLRLTIPDEVELTADDLGVEVVGAEGEEMGGEGEEIMGDEEMMGGEDDMSADMGSDAVDMPVEDEPQEMENYDMNYEGKELDDDDVVEIDENMLRRELEKMKKLNEMDASVLDDFGDGEDCGEPFVDSDDNDLNVSDRKADKGPKKESKETRINRELTEQLTEANTAIEKLRSQLKEVNLFNAKLLYTNKLLQNTEITTKQKVSIVESLDKAKSLREVQILFKSLMETLQSDSKSTKTKENKSPLKENIAKRKLIIGNSSKSVTSAEASTNQEKQLNENADFDRWARLAGITSKE